MPIKVQFPGAFEPIVLDSLALREDNTFWIHSKSDNGVGVSVPFPYGPKPAYNCADTQILLLLNPFHTESSVMEVFKQPDSKRLGYVFSLTSAGSKEHRLSESPYFQTACFAAIFNLLDQLTRSNDTVDLGLCSPNIRIGDLFKGELIILSVHSPFAREAGISLEQLVADLHRHGYVFASHPSDLSPKRLDVVRGNFDIANGEGRLKLRVISKSLATDLLISRFLSNRLSCPDDDVLRFFYLYQIIERILDRELQISRTELIRELLNTVSTGLRVLEAFHELKESLSEKNRLSTVFEKRARGCFNGTTTIDHFRSFLEGCGVEVENTYWENLYKVRNIVFHGWWSISPTVTASFKNVVASVENDVPELLLNYESEDAPGATNSISQDFSI